MSLQSLFAGSALALKGSSSTKIAYTAEEQKLCDQITSAIAAGVGVQAPKALQEVDEEVRDLLLTCHQADSGLGAAGLANKVFRERVDQIMKHNKENPDAVIPGFPKEREASSIRIMFRASCKRIGMSVKDTDSIFPAYGNGKETKKAG